MKIPFFLFSLVVASESVSCHTNQTFVSASVYGPPIGVPVAKITDPAKVRKIVSILKDRRAVDGAKVSYKYWIDLTEPSGGGPRWFFNEDGYCFPNDGRRSTSGATFRLKEYHEFNKLVGLPNPAPHP